MEISLLLGVMFITVLEMNVNFSSIVRAMGVGIAAAGLCSCSLFKNGQYASQWEIQTDVPASLSSGQAAVPEEGSLGRHQVRSNLSGAPSTLPSEEAGTLDLPGDAPDSMIDVPKPDLAMMDPRRGQSPVEMLNLPGEASSNELPSATAGSPEAAATLLSPPPPAITDEELAAAPSALPPVTPIVLPDNLNKDAPSAPHDEVLPSESPPGKTPVKTAAAPNIPLLYGKLDLAPFMPAPPEESDPANSPPQR
jgi:hypothetical protein